MIDTVEASDRCVMCGMCLPHCPTYVKTGDEGDSPRGRISLIKALHTGALPQSEALVRHLDGCLTCRACEAVCPADVPYGDLIDTARAKLRQDAKRSRPIRMLVDAYIEKRWVRRLARWLLRVYQDSGIQKLARTSGLLRLVGLARMESLVSKIDNTRLKYDEPAPGGRPSIALFTGCVAETLDRVALTAGQRLLTRLGYAVLMPSGQTCCGALYQHDGEPLKAVRLMQRNVRAFEHADTQAVLSMASGCGAQLAEYPKHLGGEGARRFARRHQDICQFVAEQEWPRQLELSALKAKVAVHSPCTLSHVLKQAEHPMKLLARIPEIELFDLPDNARCCGAAGSYVLRQPRMADALLADKVAHLKKLRPDVMVTSNIGCALHFNAGLRKAGVKIELMHPVSLLERQLVGSVMG